MTSGLVSVIIPTHNRVQYLRTTINSVLAQTYPNIEVIVVDDGSTDETPVIEQECSERVRYLRQENQGVSIARNTGIDASTGDFLTFLDDDDIMLPQKIVRQIAYFRNKPDAGLVNSAYFSVDDSGRRLSRNWLLPSGQILRELFCGNLIWTGGPLIRRSVVEKVGYFDSNYQGTEDYDYWLRTALEGVEYDCVQEPVGEYRIHPGSLMSNLGKIETGTIHVIEKNLRDSRTPAEIVNKKEDILGGFRVWFGCRYLVSHNKSEGLRNFSEALQLKPDLLTNPDSLLAEVFGFAQDPLLADPLEFIEQTFETLISLSDQFLPYKQRMLGDIKFSLALRAYLDGRSDEGKSWMKEVISHEIDWKNEIEHYEDLLVNIVLHYPDPQAVKNVTEMFSGLPDKLNALKQVQRSSLGKISVWEAFYSYYSQDRLGTLQKLGQGLITYPTALSNRGVLSILGRSALGMTPR